jgi:hypothetical protein
MIHVHVNQGVRIFTHDPQKSVRLGSCRKHCKGTHESPPAPLARSTGALVIERVEQQQKYRAGPALRLLRGVLHSGDEFRARSARRLVRLRWNL